ncbi:LLM class flavin-dependent oxidoreductase [Corynebacterium macginleyi]|uniref:LLM class flavin-dependent oxidoreductase n=1 Tax=Corynebacterium macginleyi TaxID=38290 RepID=UPI00190920E0|nr:LLM class flavin-dependent oxidoreductase [Corynebacterium macginleyi]MBK4142742.1 MsnO8 family LLM class oxidoreductase [Corynebacterium macginleyi]MBK4149078.1 MsnO8 family LLM class oxidoreductase [Corynebacterium macginleyi]MBK4158672.1 MsnO8 family LLM class oxidoreductase [Corynebacterium macginleyi]MBK4179056.1 MsnO8 family LLM class oxidoreductase [Corynebacterium macginleyi]
MTYHAPLSVLDFCTIYDGETPAQSINRSVELAQEAEKLGYSRMWYTEHHNMKSIMSSAPAVLIAHIGAKTQRIRLGSGGVMLPNHSPYVIAEQFGTLEEMYPDRIDLGVGRAPGTDMNTLGRALRRDGQSAERFPEDVQELKAYLEGKSYIPGVSAVPGANTNVPIYILGSSMFGATLAAKLGQPYAFASHFAPQHFEKATTYYRENFRPSERFTKPYVIAGVNVTAADTMHEAEAEYERVCFNRVKAFAGRGKYLTDDQIEQIIASSQGQQILDMLRYSAVGTTQEVTAYLEKFQEHAKADELMISLQSSSHENVIKNMRVLAKGWQLDSANVAGTPR